MTPPEKPARRGQPPKLPEDRADAQIQLRVTRRRKAAYVSAAQAEGMTLAAWLFRSGDAAARAAGKEPGD